VQQIMLATVPSPSQITWPVAWARRETLIMENSHQRVPQAYGARCTALSVDENLETAVNHALDVCSRGLRDGAAGVHHRPESFRLWIRYLPGFLRMGLSGAPMMPSCVPGDVSSTNTGMRGLVVGDDAAERGPVLLWRQADAGQQV
jgi:hypothetical protein